MTRETYIHVNGDDGEILLKDEPDFDYDGWVFEVSNDFVLKIPLTQLDGRMYIYEWLLDVVRDDPTNGEIELLRGTI